MKQLTFISLLLFLVLNLNAKTFTMEEGKISFETNDEFEPFSQEIIDLKFPSKRAPKFVVGTKSTKTSIAYDIKPNPLEEDGLENMRVNLSSSFTKIIPGISWIKNEIVTINDKKWITLEFKSQAIDTKINNMMLVSNYNGKMLIFNFNSTEDEFKKYEKMFQTSMNSINIKE